MSTSTSPRVSFMFEKLGHTWTNRSDAIQDELPNLLSKVLDGVLLQMGMISERPLEMRRLSAVQRLLDSRSGVFGEGVVLCSISLISSLWLRQDNNETNAVRQLEVERDDGLEQHRVVVEWCDAKDSHQAPGETPDFSLCVVRQFLESTDAGRKSAMRDPTVYVVHQPSILADSGEHDVIGLLGDAVLAGVRLGYIFVRFSRPVAKAALSPLTCRGINAIASILLRPDRASRRIERLTRFLSRSAPATPSQPEDMASQTLQDAVRSACSALEPVARDALRTLEARRFSLHIEEPSGNYLWTMVEAWELTEGNGGGPESSVVGGYVYAESEEVQTQRGHRLDRGPTVDNISVRERETFFATTNVSLRERSFGVAPEDVDEMRSLSSFKSRFPSSLGTSGELSSDASFLLDKRCVWLFVVAQEATEMVQGLSGGPGGGMGSRTRTKIVMRVESDVGLIWETEKSAHSLMRRGRFESVLQKVSSTFHLVLAERIATWRSCLVNDVARFLGQRNLRGACELIRVRLCAKSVSLWLGRWSDGKLASLDDADLRGRPAEPIDMRELMRQDELETLRRRGCLVFAAEHERALRGHEDDLGVESLYLILTEGTDEDKRCLALRVSDIACPYAGLTASDEMMSRRCDGYPGFLRDVLEAMAPSLTVYLSMSETDLWRNIEWDVFRKLVVVRPDETPGIPRERAIAYLKELHFRAPTQGEVEKIIGVKRTTFASHLPGLAEVLGPENVPWLRSSSKG